MTSQAVEATAVAGVVHATDMSLFGMFMQADIVVKLVIISLFLASLWSWAIIFEKWMRFKKVRFQANRFEHAFWSSDALDVFYDKVKKKKLDHPMAEVFSAAMEEWQENQDSKSGKRESSLKIGIRERIAQMMSVARNREVEELEKGLGFLATVGSTAPFVGLFGTVWGIMNSFQSIALTKNTTLAVVAPGIAEALFATAIGLLAAIPAVVAYNRFSGELSQIDGQLDDFSTEFTALVSRQLDEEAEEKTSGTGGKPKSKRGAA